MRVLLDTNAVVWMATQPSLLGRQVVDLVLDPGTVLLISAVVPWEIAIKWRSGRLPLAEHPREWSARVAREFGSVALPVVAEHTCRVADLPDHHRDPFDRLLIAQAQIEQVPVLTGDRTFESYDVEVIAAR